MRFLLLAFGCLFLSLAVHAAPNPELESAVRLAQAGAPQLALQALEAAPPAQPGSPDWLAAERLRLDLLASLEHADDLLRRVQQLPEGLPEDFLRHAYLAAAQAAVKLGDGAQARGYLARLFWQLEPAAGQAIARRLVVESYLAEQRAADAYPAYLRYRQDFSDFDPAALVRLTESLLEAGMAKEAATWLPQLPDGPLKSWLRLEAGLATPDEAIAEARAALQQRGHPRYWGVLLRAANLQENPLLAQEAREQLLNLAEVPAAGLLAVDAQAMWQAYSQLAGDAANQAGLLVGDDAAWLELAAKSAQASPVTAHALLAFLADHAGSAETRGEAQARLVTLLGEAGLGVAALRLYGEQAEQLLPHLLPLIPAAQHRDMLFALGARATEAGRHELAARHYLQAALLPGDAQAARRRAAQSLSKAGLHEDAVRQYQLLLQVETPARQEPAKGKPAKHERR